MYQKLLKPYFYLGYLYLLISFFIRVVFIFHPITKSNFSFFESLKTLFIGVLNDVFIFTLIACVFVLYTLFLSERKYKKPWGYLIFSLLLLIFCYITFYPNNFFIQYGKLAEQIASWFVGIKSMLFGLMLFSSSKRSKIRSGLYFFTIFLYVAFIMLNAVSEYFFWNEFGVRYNFIAVDYLIYTNEVIGNIMESYPVIPLFSIIFSVSIGISLFIYNKTKGNLEKLPNFNQKLILSGAYILMFLFSLWILKPIENIKSENMFSNEIQSNGLYKLNYAYNHSELDFNNFYSLLPKRKAEQIYLSQFQPPEFPYSVRSNKREIHKNIVLISVESLSAEFLKMYGNKQNLTPFIDSLANHSLVFTNFYATGNRTVRGLEALSMCVLPTPGESIVKRKDNKNKFTTGSLLKLKGYQVKFLYGGFSYFDNMKDFFEGNGYDVVDRSDFNSKEISFANVWGVADEDMAKKAVQLMNEESKSGKPFFNHWMTVSNHRPFTYPEGRIDISPKTQSRDGGVKYTDYAINLFFKLAKKQDWYKNTVFIIVADHCASSAGKTELPMDKYRIPALVFTPDGSIQAQKFNGLMSQIDLMPTVLAQLNFSYESKFSGQNVFNQNFEPRAFIATYQDLGYVRDNYLTIISPGKEINQYSLKEQISELPKDFSIYYDEILVSKPKQYLVDETIGNYQTVYNYLKSGKYNIP